MIEILSYLHQFVPTVDGSLKPIMCCGDGLSVERMIHCKRCRNGAETPTDRLEGLIPVPQEFHKEVLLLQVSLICLSIMKGHFWDVSPNI